MLHGCVTPAVAPPPPRRRSFQVCLELNQTWMESGVSEDAVSGHIQVGRGHREMISWAHWCRGWVGLACTGLGGAWDGWGRGIRRSPGGWLAETVGAWLRKKRGGGGGHRGRGDGSWRRCSTHASAASPHLSAPRRCSPAGGGPRRHRLLCVRAAAGGCVRWAFRGAGFNLGSLLCLGQRAIGDRRWSWLEQGG